MMANNSAQCIQLLYEMVDTMTVANGYNYDWLQNKGGDKFYRASSNPKMYIRMGPEDNADLGGAIGNNSYIDDLQFNLTAKIALTKSDIRPEDIDYEQDQAISRMKDDVKKRFSSPSYIRNARETRPEIVFRARTLVYNGSQDPVIQEDGDKYSTMRLVSNITVKYESERF